MIDAVTGRRRVVAFTGKRIRGGSGLGDSLYVRAVADHFVRAGEEVIVRSNFPDVFTGAGVKVEPFSRDGCNVVAHYSARKAATETNQWQDVCISAGVPGLALSFRWAVRNVSVARDIQAAAKGKPIVMINGGRWPMGRSDGYAREMLPKREAFASALAALGGCFTVEIGSGEELYPLVADLDMTNCTSVSDLIDIAAISSGMVGQCSFLIPLAEALDKPLLCVWASAGFRSETLFIRQCTPEKLLSKSSSRWVMDDWDDDRIKEAARAFCQF